MTYILKKTEAQLEQALKEICDESTKKTEQFLNDLEEFEENSKKTNFRVKDGYELKKTDAQGRAEQRQRELRNDRCHRCDADLDPDFAVDGFCDDRCKKLYIEEVDQAIIDAAEHGYDPFDDDRTELYRDRAGYEYWRRPRG